MNAERFRIIVGWVIVVTWVGSIIVDAVVPAYDVPITINGAMMLVAGWLFGPTITGRTRRREDEP